MDSRLVAGIARESRKRYGLLGKLFAEQRAFVLSPARRKALLTPRRAGKTVAACVMLFLGAIASAGSKFLYCAMTRPNARDIAWEIFKALNSEFDLGAQFHESALEIRMPNGSLIMLRGADQPNWIERLEGQHFKIIVVDECASFNVDLKRLVLVTFKPMLADERGAVCLIGRPGLVRAGFFWDVTRPDAENRTTGWEFHSWTTFDNPYMEAQWREELEELLANNPGVSSEPWFLSHYRGEWANDARASVYSGFDELRHVIELPWTIEPDDRFVGGVDFGWDDSTAVGVGVWNLRRSKKLRYISCVKRREWLLSEVGDYVQTLMDKYPGVVFYGDPAKKQLLMEMVARFGAQMVEAEKSDKRTWIDLYNTACSLGEIEIERVGCADYIAELNTLKRYYPGLRSSDGDAASVGDWEEHPRQPNDCCDVGLYIFRHAYQYRYRDPIKKPQKGSPAAMEAQMEETWEREARAMRKRAKREWWRG